MSELPSLISLTEGTQRNNNDLVDHVQIQLFERHKDWLSFCKRYTTQLQAISGETTIGEFAGHSLVQQAAGTNELLNNGGAESGKRTGSACKRLVALERATNKIVGMLLFTSPHEATVPDISRHRSVRCSGRGNTLYVHIMFVLDKYRRRGIGDLMAKALVGVYFMSPIMSIQLPTVACMSDHGIWRRLLKEECREAQRDNLLFPLINIETSNFPFATLPILNENIVLWGTGSLQEQQKPNYVLLEKAVEFQYCLTLEIDISWPAVFATLTLSNVPHVEHSCLPFETAIETLRSTCCKYLTATVYISLPFVLKHTVDWQAKHATREGAIEYVTGQFDLIFGPRIQNASTRR